MIAGTVRPNYFITRIQNHNQDRDQDFVCGFELECEDGMRRRCTVWFRFRAIHKRRQRLLKKRTRRSKQYLLTVMVFGELWVFTLVSFVFVPIFVGQFSYSFHNYRVHSTNLIFIFMHRKILICL